MPLPRRVPSRDLDATMAGPSSYRDDLGPSDETRPQGTRRPDLPQPQPGQPQRGQTVPPAGPPQTPRSPQSYSRAPVGRAQQPPPAAPSRQQPIRRPQPQRQAARRPAKKRSRRSTRRPLTWGCVAQIAGLALVAGLVMVLLGGGAVSIYYARETAPAFKGINNITDLQQKALQFQTTRIRDRDGNVLYEINDPQGGFRNYVTLDEVSPWVIVATVATEERNYFTNPGFSVPAIGRAVYQNLKSGDVVSGASTITQQLTRALLLPEEQRTQRSYQRKIKEVFLAAELGRRFSKRDVLELYLNQIYYGNLAYGIEAASQTYFGKSAKDLNLAEASFLAGLPQAPAVYDPVNDRAVAIRAPAAGVEPDAAGRLHRHRQQRPATAVHHAGRHHRRAARPDRRGDQDLQRAGHCG